MAVTYVLWHTDHVLQGMFPRLWGSGCSAQGGLGASGFGCHRTSTRPTLFPSFWTTHCSLVFLGGALVLSSGLPSNTKEIRSEVSFVYTKLYLFEFSCRCFVCIKWIKLTLNVRILHFGDQKHKLIHLARYLWNKSIFIFRTDGRTDGRTGWSSGEAKEEHRRCQDQWQCEYGWLWFQET